MKKLKEYIELRIDEVSEVIENRALEYSEELSQNDRMDIYDVNTDNDFVAQYDQEDMENHNYDLGRYYALKEIGGFIDEHF